MSKSITADKDYQTKLEENFLGHIGHEYAEILCDDLDIQQEQWQNLAIPESLDQWFHDFHRIQTKRAKRKHLIMKVASRAAIFILFFVAVNFFLMTNVEAYRKQLIKAVVDIQQSFTQIDFVPADREPLTPPTDWTGLYYLTYIPKGYRMVDSKVNGPVSYINYVNDKGDRIAFQEYYMHVSMQIDTENAEVSDVMVNDVLAKMVEKADFKIMYWVQDDQVLYLETHNLSRRETVKIANSIKLNKSTSEPKK